MSTPVQPNRDSAYDTYDDGRNNWHPDDNVTMRPRDLRRSTPPSGDQPRGERTQRSAPGSSDGGRRSSASRSDGRRRDNTDDRRQRSSRPNDVDYTDYSNDGAQPNNRRPQLVLHGGESTSSDWRDDEPAARIDDVEPDDRNWGPRSGRSDDYDDPQDYSDYRTPGPRDGGYGAPQIGPQGGYQHGNRYDGPRSDPRIEAVNQALEEFNSTIGALGRRLFPQDQSGRIVADHVDTREVYYLVDGLRDYLRSGYDARNPRRGDDTTPGRRQENYDDRDDYDYDDRDERNNRTNGRRPSGGFGRTVRRVVSRFIDDREPDDND